MKCILTVQMLQDKLKPNAMCDSDHNIDGSLKERRDPRTLAIELRLSCLNPLFYYDIHELKTTSKLS